MNIEKNQRIKSFIVYSLHKPLFKLLQLIYFVQLVVP